MKLLLLAAAVASTSTLVAASSTTSTATTCLFAGCPASVGASTCDNSLQKQAVSAGANVCCALKLDCTNPGTSSSSICSSLATSSSGSKQFYYFLYGTTASCKQYPSLDPAFSSATPCYSTNCNTFESIAGSAPAPSPSTASPAASSGSTASPAAATGGAGSTASPAASPTTSTASKCYEGACLSTTDSSSCQNSLVEVPSQGACCVFTIDCTNAAQHSGTSAAAYCQSFSGYKINYYLPMQTVQQCKQVASSDSTGLITGAGGCTSDDCNNSASTGKVLASSNGAAGAVTAAKHVGAAALAAGVLGAALAA